MSREDGQSYELDGRVLPSLRAMQQANLYAYQVNRWPPYYITDYYDEPEGEGPF